MRYKNFEDMPIWQEAMDIAIGVHTISEGFPRKEDYGLTSQIRRSALSVSANIAEAFGRHHRLDKLCFYYNARGSLAETKSHLIYSNRIGYVNSELFKSLEERLRILNINLGKVIASLSKSR